MTKHRLQGLILLPIAAGLLLSTTGCSAVIDAVHRTHQETFTDRAAAERGWVGVDAPTWLPADAADIHDLATDDESQAVILAHGSSPLPSTCQEADRRGIPFDTASWAPVLDRFPDRVARCGDYEVMPVDGGWLGWFSATEAGQRPTAAAR
ncbi:hypothetical protein [Amnibacterium endophyticum]|uniref:Lipoprotein n=1 Tax=Amnibacterium endophyticum TaxID=2109337 RepID=A0ABW4LA78_9MICO